MSRSQFLLGVTLLCVSATLAFSISFRKREEHSQAKSNSESPVPVATEQKITGQGGRRLTPPIPLIDRKVPKLDPTHYEVTVVDESLQETGEMVQKQTREQLEKMTKRYQLTPNQRREIYPLLVAYHPERVDGLIANGFTTSPKVGKTLVGELYPILDAAQQEAYQEELLADDEWWSEIIGQLREDFDTAFESGEFDLVTEARDLLPRAGGAADEEGSTLEEDGDIDPSDFFPN